MSKTITAEKTAAKTTAKQQPWQAEQRADRELATRLIERQFPQLAPVDAVLLGEGWDNTAYRVDDLVFRFPRRQIAVELLRAEVQLLPAIAGSLPLAIPVPRWLGEPSTEFSWPFAGYRMLPGITACRGRLADEQRNALAEPLATFLAALHRIGEPQARHLGATEDRLGRLDLAKRKGMLDRRLDEAEELGVLPMRAALQRVIDDTPDDWQPSTTSLVHGDFYVRHLLLDEAARLTGVIDWGDVHVGDPAVDLAIAFGFLTLPGREVFRRHYGWIDDQRWLVARFRALFHALALLVYGHDIEDTDLMFEGRRSLDQLAATATS